MSDQQQTPLAMVGNQDKTPSLWMVAFCVAVLVALSMSGITRPLLALMSAAPLIPLGLAVAVVAGRKLLARDVALTDAVAAVAPVALAAYLATVDVPNRSVGLDQWEALSFIGGAWAVLAIGIGLPAIGVWKKYDNGQRVRVKTLDQNGVYVEHHEDSRTRHRYWFRQNLTAKTVIALCIVVIFAGAHDKSLLWVAAWAATFALACALVFFGWGQFVRLSFVAYQPRPVAPPLDPTGQQTQSQQPRRKKLS